MIEPRPQDAAIPGEVLALRDQMIELLDLARFEAWVQQADESIKFWPASTHHCPLACYFSSEFYTDNLLPDEILNLPSVGHNALISIYTTDYVVSVIPEQFHFQYQITPWQEIVRQVDAFKENEPLPHSTVIQIVDLVKQIDTDSTAYEIKVRIKESETAWYFMSDGTLKGRIIL